MACRTACVASLVCLAGCATLSPESRANAVKGPAPELGDRCARATDILVQKGCQRDRDKAHAYLKTLNQGDTVCLDPLFDADMTNCRARAEIEDQDPTATQIHLFDTDPNSSWAPKANQKIWYENTALIDLYLQGKGF
jgi:hypothetical protein